NTASTPHQRDTWLDVELRAQRQKNNDHAWPVWIFRMVLVGGFLALWEYAVVRGWVNVFFVSSPSAIAKFLVENIQTTTFWTDTWITLQETLYGFLSAGVCGVLAAFVLAQNRLLRDTLDPILSFLNSLPR